MSAVKNVGDHMPRALFNATIIPEIVERIEKEYGINEREALDVFYRSIIAEALNDPETGLYGQSALYIFSLFKEEAEERHLFV